MSPHDPLASHIRIDTAHARALTKLGIATVQDLLYHFPARYEQAGSIRPLAAMNEGEHVTIIGKLGGLTARKAWKSKKPIAEGWIEDGSARVKLMWFNQPYIAKMYHNGSMVKLSGAVAGSGSKLYIANPSLTEVPIGEFSDGLFATDAAADTSSQIFAIYPESKGITSHWLQHALRRCFEAGVLETLNDPLPDAVRTRYNLPGLADALHYIHTPEKEAHALAAQKRFAFEEVFTIQTRNAQERRQISAADCYTFATNAAHIGAFTERLPFALTGAQEKALAHILRDLDGTAAMSRLIEGDVGSGKTAVAAIAAYATCTARPDTKKDWGNLQVAYMAPTEILAKQHFEGFIQHFKHLPIQIGLITGSGCMKFPSKVDPTKATPISKAQLLKWVANGEIPILIGTHALVYKKVAFKHLALVIIDEQHRFGVAQRKALTQKGAPIPHLLSMTATPIPRTLALTIYGDLDITLLDEMPAGRKPVVTQYVAEADESAMYRHIISELEAGRQAYVICPRIDEPDQEKEVLVAMKSVTAEAKRLGAGPLKGWRIGVLHGSMTPTEKDKVMADFAAHRLDVLCATSVVEVGVNVPNATNIIIEGAERFGLSQLHQLRGRVIRGTHQPYCFACTTSRAATIPARLKAFVETNNGFTLAERDLEFRGAGELYGRSQSGISDMGMNALKNIKLVEAAREEARALVAHDPELTQHPYLTERITRLGTLHME